MVLPMEWERFLAPCFDLQNFYPKLEKFLGDGENVIPEKGLIFHVFSRITPGQVRCVLYGEDPYPRITSANGIAFWDAEINEWGDRSNGNALKNILKALLVAMGQASYRTSIAECRDIAGRIHFFNPSQLFEFWLQQGLFPVNAAMTFSSSAAKTRHFAFWRPFHAALIHALNVRGDSPHYVLWGRKAWRWEDEILKSIDQPSKIIKQGHPTFIHQFLDATRPDWSPFQELQQRTPIKWY